MNKKALLHFKKVDPILYSAAINFKVETHSPKDPSEYFYALCRSIVGQQLSGRVADVIFGRFLKLFPKKNPTPEKILKLKEEEIREVGMSYAKIRSLKDLAQKVKTRELEIERLEKLTDEEVLAQLIRVKGVGPWTAEMFLMFTLGREDLFSHGDLGLKNGIKKLYGLENPSREEIEKLSSKWSPYRTYASLVLWKSLE